MLNLYDDIRLIGLVGKSGSGKDTLADAVNGDWTKMAFADSLKHLCMDYLGLSYDDVYTQEGKSRMNAHWGMTNREILQKVGTDAMRNGFDNDVWVKIAELKIRKMLDEGKRVIITDCRFGNEAALIEKLGGVVVDVVRNAGNSLTEQEKNHVSEQPVDRKYVAFSVDNNGNISRIGTAFRACLNVFQTKYSEATDVIRKGVLYGRITDSVASKALLEMKKFVKEKPSAVYAANGTVRLEYNNKDSWSYAVMSEESVLFGMKKSDGTKNELSFEYGDMAKWNEIFN